MKKGFTLLEIFFVLGVLAILLSFILPSFKGLSDETDQTRAMSDLAILQTALESYFSKQHIYPETDYQNVLMAESNPLINKRFYDPFAGAKIEYSYYKVPGLNFYLIYSPGINRQTDIDLQNEINAAQGTFSPKTNLDDVFVTNLKILNP